MPVALLMPRTSHCLSHLLECSISRTCRRSSFVLFLCCAESLLLHYVFPSFIDVCLVLFRSAPSSLLLLFLLLHPVLAACTWGLFFCFQLCLSLPLQEWTSRSTFRSVRRRNDKGSTAGTGWRRAEVWIRAEQNGTMYRERLCVFVYVFGFMICFICQRIKHRESEKMGVEVNE